jgi:hypothetical protein
MVKKRENAYFFAKILVYISPKTEYQELVTLQDILERKGITKL